MDNKRLSNPDSQVSTSNLYSVSSQAQQAVPSTDSDQQAVFSGRSATPTNPAQPEIPLPTYDELTSGQRSLAELGVATNTTVQPFSFSREFGSDPMTDTQQPNIGSTGRVLLADEDPFRVLANYQPLSFDESLLPPPGTTPQDPQDPLPEAITQPRKRTHVETSSVPTTARQQRFYYQPLKKGEESDLIRYLHLHLHLMIEIIRNPEQKRLFQCGFPNCGKTYTHLSHLKEHFFYHTGISNYRCPYTECGDYTYFSNKSNLNKHIRANHTKEKPHYCEICDFRANEKYNLKTHMLNRHGIKL